jgi:tyrosyl-tRNA synthetase
MKRYDELFAARSTESWEGIGSGLATYLKAKSETVIPESGLEEKLSLGRPLSVKLGIDPTGADLHLGHLVPVMILKQFLRAGHKVDLIIGDFTARIGDPSGRETARTPLSAEEIERHAATYAAQIEPYIDVSRISVHRNSTWLSGMTLEDLFPILQTVSLSEAMQRDDFRARVKNEQAVTLAEATYGVLMGLDSVALKTDIEIGGLDQLLNFMQCREVMKTKGLVEEAVITAPILLGTTGDGRKMSKSFGNYVPLRTTDDDMFGKIMSAPDDRIVPYFTAFADVRLDEVPELMAFAASEPLEAKKQVATFIVSLASGLEAGVAAREHFEKTFSKKEVTADDAVPVTYREGMTVFDALWETGDFESKTELRRLFTDGAVRTLSTDAVIAPDALCADVHDPIRVGKRRFYVFFSG